MSTNNSSEEVQERLDKAIKEFRKDKSFKRVAIIGCGGFGMTAINTIAKQHLEVIVLEDKKQREELKINDFLEIKPRNILKDDFDYLPQKVKHRKKRKFF
jgi:UDP-N-acetylmuramoylalanine-D-glutamate ligase